MDLTWQSTTMHTLIDGNILSETSIPFFDNPGSWRPSPTCSAKDAAGKLSAPIQL